MFDCLDTLLSHLVLGLHMLVPLRIAAMCLVVIFDDSSHELERCCTEVGMGFEHSKNRGYTCLDYKESKLVSVTKKEDRCFYGEAK